MPLSRSAFAEVLQRAVVGALGEFRSQTPSETPYALAVMLGQCGDYLGYAVATEEGLQRVAAQHAANGYRYQGEKWEEFDNLERLATWLRWSNPDDGWCCGDFAERHGVAPLLASLVESGEFGADGELEEFCTDVLARLQSDREWLALDASGSIVIGVTSGSDPRDFLRTATRANAYGTVRRLWEEHWRGEELSHKISRRN
jgi:hypothetical protein